MTSHTDMSEDIVLREPSDTDRPMWKICAAASESISVYIFEQGFAFAHAAESPIEEVFGTAICAYYKFIDANGHSQRFCIWPAEQFDDRCKDLEDEEINRFKEYDILGASQYHIEDKRVDFIFAGKNWRTGKVFRLVVECDGHDFHERTKEQAARDRSRDRFLQEKAYWLFRFTGSEIWKDPMGCAEQVADWISHKSCEKP